MYPIASFSDLGQVEASNVVVSTFVADAKHSSSVRWLFDTYGWLHERSGYSWHIIVPVQHPPKDRELQFKDYDYDLADQLRNSMGIARDTLPCFIFDNFIEEEKQFGIRLPPDDDDRARLIETVADFVDARMKALQDVKVVPSRENRRRTTRALESYFEKRKRKDWASVVAEHGLIHLPAIGIPLAEHFIRGMAH